MTNSAEIEIGWKKELLEGGSDDKCSSSAKKHRSPSESSNSSSSTSSSSSSGSNSGGDERKKRKKEKREKHKQYKLLKKEKKKLEKAQRREIKKARKEKRKEEKRLKKLAKKVQNREEAADCSIPIDLMYAKAHAPETKEEYEARQSKIRREIDPVTGRARLIKGDGEILEEIVSKEQHREINRRATQGDGDFFQSKTVGWKF